MIYLQKIKSMASPEPEPNAWYILLVNVLPWATLYGLTHTAIYYVFKYWTDSREESIQRAVDAKFEEHIKPLEAKIDNLTNMFLAQHSK